jgi:DNA-binding transcriptional ArsR family regulator
MDKQAALLAAMANSTRLEILTILQEGEAPVGSLAQRTGTSQSAVSQHLSKLKDLRLVRSRRDGQAIYYSSTSEVASLILRALAKLGEERVVVPGYQPTSMPSDNEAEGEARPAYRPAGMGRG